jgi:cytochrome c556
MTSRFKTFALSTLAVGLLTVASTGWAQQAPKPEQIIKWRQSVYQVLAWNTGRIRASVDGTFNKDEVVKAANSIAAIANSGLGALYAPGTETGKGWRETTVKPEVWTESKKVAEIAGNFTHEATELARVAQVGDAAQIKAQLGKLNATCKACHDDFRKKD